MRQHLSADVWAAELATPACRLQHLERSPRELLHCRWKSFPTTSKQFEKPGSSDIGVSTYPAREDISTPVDPGSEYVVSHMLLNNLRFQSLDL